MKSFLTHGKPILWLVIVAFLANTILGQAPVQADVPFLPVPGQMVALTPAYSLPQIRGIKVFKNDPFKFEFVMSQGDGYANQAILKQEAGKLVKYFLASLTTPEKDIWVNLSPFERNRIVPKNFGMTEMGKELLAQDYLLKQVTASVIYPEGEVGKAFWHKIYDEAYKRFGTTNVPVSTFNKVWIVPQAADVYENPKTSTAVIIKSSLKVMLEEDYLAMVRHSIPSEESQAAKASPTGINLLPQKDVNQLGSRVIREIVIPALDKEVNEGKNFAVLRQVYNSLILAYWYKNRLKQSLISQGYVDRNKTGGIDVKDREVDQKIYEQYLKSYRKGVYNYIKEESSSPVQANGQGEELTPRKYFSGGIQLAKFGGAELQISSTEDSRSRAMLSLRELSSKLIYVAMTLSAVFSALAPSAIQAQAVPAPIVSISGEPAALPGALPVTLKTVLAQKIQSSGLADKVTADQLIASGRVTITEPNGQVIKNLEADYVLKSGEKIGFTLADLNSTIGATSGAAPGHGKPPDDVSLFRADRSGPNAPATMSASPLIDLGNIFPNISTAPPLSLPSAAPAPSADQALPNNTNAPHVISFTPPVPGGEVSSGFGERSYVDAPGAWKVDDVAWKTLPNGKKVKVEILNQGIDWAGPVGSPILAMMDGTITAVNFDQLYHTDRTVEIAKFSGLSFIKDTVLDPNNREGVWRQVSATKVALKPGFNLQKEDVDNIAFGDSQRIWAILQDLRLREGLFVSEEGEMGGHHFKIVYMHALKGGFPPGIRPGMRVQAGQKIAEIGLTGRTTGAHTKVNVYMDGTAIDYLNYLGIERPEIPKVPPVPLPPKVVPILEARPAPAPEEPMVAINDSRPLFPNHTIDTGEVEPSKLISVTAGRGSVIQAIGISQNTHVEAGSPPADRFNSVHSVLINGSSPITSANAHRTKLEFQEDIRYDALQTRLNDDNPPVIEIVSEGEKDKYSKILRFSKWLGDGSGHDTESFMDFAHGGEDKMGFSNVHFYSHIAPPPDAGKIDIHDVPQMPIIGGPEEIKERALERKSAIAEVTWTDSSGKLQRGVVFASTKAAEKAYLILLHAVIDRSNTQLAMDFLKLNYDDQVIAAKKWWNINLDPAGGINLAIDSFSDRVGPNNREIIEALKTNGIIEQVSDREVRLKVSLEKNAQRIHDIIIHENIGNEADANNTVALLLDSIKGRAVVAAVVDRDENGMIMSIKGLIQARDVSDDKVIDGVPIVTIKQKDGSILMVKPWTLGQTSVLKVSSYVTQREAKNVEDNPQSVRAEFSNYTYQNGDPKKGGGNPYMRGEILWGENYLLNEQLDNRMSQLLAAKNLQDLHDGYIPYLQGKETLNLAAAGTGMALSFTGLNVPTPFFTNFIYDLIKRPDLIGNYRPDTAKWQELYAKMVILHGKDTENKYTTSTETENYFDNLVNDTWDQMGTAQRQDAMDNAYKRVIDLKSYKDMQTFYAYLERVKDRKTADFILNQVALISQVSSQYLPLKTVMTDIPYKSGPGYAVNPAFNVQKYPALYDVLSGQYVSITGNINLENITSLVLAGQALPSFTFSQLVGGPQPRQQLGPVTGVVKPISPVLDAIGRFTSVIGFGMDGKSFINDIYHHLTGDYQWQPFEGSPTVTRFNASIMGYNTSITEDKNNAIKMYNFLADTKSTQVVILKNGHWDDDVQPMTFDHFNELYIKGHAIPVGKTAKISIGDQQMEVPVYEVELTNPYDGTTSTQTVIFSIKAISLMGWNIDSDLEAYENYIKSIGPGGAEILRRAQDGTLDVNLWTHLHAAYDRQRADAFPSSYPFVEGLAGIDEILRAQSAPAGKRDPKLLKTEQSGLDLFQDVLNAQLQLKGDSPLLPLWLWPSAGFQGFSQSYNAYTKQPQGPPETPATAGVAVWTMWDEKATGNLDSKHHPLLTNIIQWLHQVKAGHEQKFSRKALPTYPGKAEAYGEPNAVAYAAFYNYGTNYQNQQADQPLAAQARQDADDILQWAATYLWDDEKHMFRHEEGKDAYTADDQTRFFLAFGREKMEQVIFKNQPGELIKFFKAVEQNFGTDVTNFNGHNETVHLFDSVTGKEAHDHEIRPTNLAKEQDKGLRLGLTAPSLEFIQALKESLPGLRGADLEWAKNKIRTYSNTLHNMEDKYGRLPQATVKNEGIGFGQGNTIEGHISLEAGVSNDIYNKFSVNPWNLNSPPRLANDFGFKPMPINIPDYEMTYGELNKGAIVQPGEDYYHAWFHSISNMMKYYNLRQTDNVPTINPLTGKQELVRLLAPNPTDQGSQASYIDPQGRVIFVRPIEPKKELIQEKDVAAENYTVSTDLRDAYRGQNSFPNGAYIDERLDGSRIGMPHANVKDALDEVSERTVPERAFVDYKGYDNYEVKNVWVPEDHKYEDVNRHIFFPLHKPVTSDRRDENGLIATIVAEDARIRFTVNDQTTTVYNYDPNFGYEISTQTYPNLVQGPNSRQATVNLLKQGTWQQTQSLFKGKIPLEETVTEWVGYIDRYKVRLSQINPYDLRIIKRHADIWTGQITKQYISLFDRPLTEAGRDTVIDNYFDAYGVVTGSNTFKNLGTVNDYQRGDKLFEDTVYIMLKDGTVIPVGKDIENLYGAVSISELAEYLNLLKGSTLDPYNPKTIWQGLSSTKIKLKPDAVLKEADVRAVVQANTIAQFKSSVGDAKDEKALNDLIESNTQKVWTILKQGLYDQHHMNWVYQFDVKHAIQRAQVINAANSGLKAAWLFTDPFNENRFDNVMVPTYNKDFMGGRVAASTLIYNNLDQKRTLSTTKNVDLKTQNVTVNESDLWALGDERLGNVEKVIEPVGGLAIHSAWINDLDQKVTVDSTYTNNQLNVSSDTKIVLPQNPDVPLLAAHAEGEYHLNRNIDKKAFLSAVGTGGTDANTILSKLFGAGLIVQDARATNEFRLVSDINLNKEKIREIAGNDADFKKVWDVLHASINLRQWWNYEQDTNYYHNDPKQSIKIKSKENRLSAGGRLILSQDLIYDKPKFPINGEEEYHQNHRFEFRYYSDENIAQKTDSILNADGTSTLRKITDLQGYSGLVFKADFIDADPNGPVSGASKLQALIDKGILEEVSPNEVRLKRAGSQPVTRPSEMQAAGYDEIWDIFQQSHDGYFAAKYSKVTQVAGGKAYKKFTVGTLLTTPEEYRNRFIKEHIRRNRVAIKSNAYEDASWIENNDSEGRLRDKTTQDKDETTGQVYGELTQHLGDFDVQGSALTSQSDIVQNGHKITFSVSTDVTTDKDAQYDLFRTQIQSDPRFNGLTTQELKDKETGRILEFRIGIIDAVTHQFKPQVITTFYDFNDIEIPRHAVTIALDNGVWRLFNSSELLSTYEDIILKEHNIKFAVHDHFLSTPDSSRDRIDTKNYLGLVVEHDKGYFEHDANGKLLTDPDGKPVWHTTRAVLSSLKGIPGLIGVPDSAVTWMVKDGKRVVRTDESNVMTANGQKIDNIHTVPVEDIFGGRQSIRYGGVVLGEDIEKPDVAHQAHQQYQQIRNGRGDVTITLYGHPDAKGGMVIDDAEYQIYEIEGPYEFKPSEFKPGQAEALINAIESQTGFTVPKGADAVERLNNLIKNPDFDQKLKDMGKSGQLNNEALYIVKSELDPDHSDALPIGPEKVRGVIEAQFQDLTPARQHHLGNFGDPISAMSAVPAANDNQIPKSYSNNTKPLPGYLAFKTQEGLGTAAAGLTLTGDVYKNHEAIAAYLRDHDHVLRLDHIRRATLQYKNPDGWTEFALSGQKINPVTGFGMGDPVFVNWSRFNEERYTQALAEKDRTFIWNSSMGDVEARDSITPLKNYFKWNDNTWSFLKTNPIATLDNLTFSSGQTVASAPGGAPPDPDLATYDVNDKDRGTGLVKVSLKMYGAPYRNVYDGDGLNGRPGLLGLYFDQYASPAFATDMRTGNAYAVYNPTYFKYHGVDYVLSDEYVAPPKGPNGRYDITGLTPHISTLMKNGIVVLTHANDDWYIDNSPWPSVLSSDILQLNGTPGKFLHAVSFLPTEIDKAWEHGRHPANDNHDSELVLSQMDSSVQDLTFQARTGWQNFWAGLGTFGTIIGASVILYAYMFFSKLYGFNKRAKRIRRDQNANFASLQAFEDMGFTREQAELIMNERFKNGGFISFEDFKRRLEDQLNQTEVESKKKHVQFLFKKVLPSVKSAMEHVRHFQFEQKADAFTPADALQLKAQGSVNGFMDTWKGIYGVTRDQETSFNNVRQFLSRFLTPSDLKAIVNLPQFTTLANTYSRRRAGQVILRLMYAAIREKPEFLKAIGDEFDQLYEETGMDRHFKDQRSSLKDTFIRNIRDNRNLPEGFNLEDFDAQGLPVFAADDLRKSPDMERQVTSKLVSVRKLFVFQVIFQRVLYSQAGGGIMERWLWKKYVEPVINDSRTLINARVADRIVAFRQVFQSLMLAEVRVRQDNNSDVNGTAKHYLYTLDERTRDDAFQYLLGDKDPTLKDAGWKLSPEVMKALESPRQQFERILKKIDTVMDMKDEKPRRLAVQAIAAELQPVMLAFVAAVDKKTGLTVVNTRIAPWQMKIVPLWHLFKDRVLQQRVTSNGGPYNQTSKDMQRRSSNYLVIGLVSLLFAVLGWNFLGLWPYIALTNYLAPPWGLAAFALSSIVSAWFIAPKIKNRLVKSLGADLQQANGDKKLEAAAQDKFNRNKGFLYGGQVLFVAISTMLVPFFMPFVLPVITSFFSSFSIPIISPLIAFLFPVLPQAVGYLIPIPWLLSAVVHMIPLLVFMNTWLLTFSAMNDLVATMAVHIYYKVNNVYELKNHRDTAKIASYLMSVFAQTRPPIGSRYKIRGQENLLSFINIVRQMTGGNSQVGENFALNASATVKDALLTDVLTEIARNLVEVDSKGKFVRINDERMRQLEAEIQAFVLAVARPVKLQARNGKFYYAKNAKPGRLNALVRELVGEEKSGLQVLIDYINGNYRRDKGGSPLSLDQVTPMTIVVNGHNEVHYIPSVKDLFDVTKIDGQSEEFTHLLGLLAHYKTKIFLQMVERMTRPDSLERDELLLMIDDPTYVPREITKIIENPNYHSKEDWNNLLPDILEWANLNLGTGYANVVSNLRTTKSKLLFEAEIFGLTGANAEAFAQKNIRIIDRNLQATAALDKVLGGKLREMMDVLIETKYKSTAILNEDGSVKRGIENPIKLITDYDKPLDKNYSKLMLKKLYGLIREDRLFPVTVLGGTDPLTTQSYVDLKWIQLTGVLPDLIGPVVLSLDADHKATYADFEYYLNHLLEYYYVPGIGISTPIIKHELTRGFGPVGDAMAGSENAFYGHSQQGKDLMGSLLAYGKLFARVAAVRWSRFINSKIPEDAESAQSIQVDGYITARAGYVKTLKAWIYSMLSGSAPQQKWSTNPVDQMVSRSAQKSYVSPLVSMTSILNNYVLQGYGWYMFQASIVTYLFLNTIVSLILGWNPFSGVPLALWIIGSFILSQSTSSNAIFSKVHDQSRGWGRGLTSTVVDIVRYLPLFAYNLFMYLITSGKIGMNRLTKSPRTAGKATNPSRIENKHRLYLTGSRHMHAAVGLTIIFLVYAGLSPWLTLYWSTILMMGPAAIVTWFWFNPVKPNTPQSPRNRFRDIMTNLSESFTAGLVWGIVDIGTVFLDGLNRFSRFIPGISRIVDRTAENNLQIKVMDQIDAYLPRHFSELLKEPRGVREGIFNTIFGNNGPNLLLWTENLYVYHQATSHPRDMFRRVEVPLIDGIMSILAQTTQKPDTVTNFNQKSRPAYGIPKKREELKERLKLVREYLKVLKSVKEFEGQVTSAQNQELRRAERLLWRPNPTAEQLKEADWLIYQLGKMPGKIENRKWVEWRDRVANFFLVTLGGQALIVIPLAYVQAFLGWKNSFDKKYQDEQAADYKKAVNINGSSALSSASPAMMAQRLVNGIYPEDPAQYTAAGMPLNPLKADNGGIDLGRTVVRVKSSGGTIQTAFDDPAMLRLLLNSDGLTSIIKEMKPMTPAMVNNFMGVN